MSLGLRFCWSLWTDPGAPGRTLVDEVAGRLVELGWHDLGFQSENLAPLEVRPDDGADPGIPRKLRDRRGVE